MTGSIYHGLDSEEEKAARRVRCPFCGAEQGAYCEQPNPDSRGRMVRKAHKRRRIYAAARAECNR